MPREREERSAVSQAEAEAINSKSNLFLFHS
jgi:hypothetical protein